MPTVKENLIAAKALIDTPETWAQGGYEPTPGCFCSLGAIAKAVGHNVDDAWYGPVAQVYAALRESLPEMYDDVPNFNDSPSTTHADIMALFDRAIGAQDDAP